MPNQRSRLGKQSVLLGIAGIILLLALSKFAGLVLKKPVQKQVAVDLFKSAQEMAEQGDQDGAIAQYKVAVIGGAPLQAYGNLASLYAGRRDFLNALDTLDRGIQVGKETSDSFEPQLGMMRIQLLDSLPYREVDASPELKKYVCGHDLYVVAASVKGNPDAQLANIRRYFPHTHIGVRPSRPLNPEYSPIVADSFLTCEEAQRLVIAVEARFKTAPFVGKWHNQCPSPCGGVPWEIGSEPH